MISEQDIDRALAYLRDNSDKDAQARAERLYMEQWVKTVLAQEMAKQGDKSVAAQEVGARISDAYLAALNGYKEAIHEDEKRRFLRSAAETRIEAWRTMSSNERAQGKVG